jgi:hypothetical protein
MTVSQLPKIDGNQRYRTVDGTFSCGDPATGALFRQGKIE